MESLLHVISFTLDNLLILEDAGEVEFNVEKNSAHKLVNLNRTIDSAAPASVKVDSVGSTSVFAENPVTVKVECAENCVERSSVNCMNGSSVAEIQAVNFEPEMSDEFFDELDHVALKERLTRLLTRFLFLSVNLS